MLLLTLQGVDGHAARARLLVASVGGQCRGRPKELLFSSDRTALRCEWYDYEEATTRYRNFMIDWRNPPPL